jgi:hypothetical protein
MISLDLPEGTIAPVPGGVSDHHITICYIGPDVDDGAFALACLRAQQAAAAIRAAGGTFPLVIEGDDWSSCTTWAAGQPNASFQIADQNWIPSTHLYCDYGHGQYPLGSWGSYTSIKSVTGYFGASPQMAVEDLQYFLAYLKANGHKKALVGEFGVPSWPIPKDEANAPQLWNAVAGEVGEVT